MEYILCFNVFCAVAGVGRGGGGGGGGGGGEGGGEGLRRNNQNRRLLPD